MKNIKKISIFILLGIFIVGIFGYKYYRIMLSPNVPKDLKSDLVQIPSGLDFEEVVTLLKSQRVIENEDNFRSMAKQMGYDTNPVRAGQFKIAAGIGNYRLVHILKNHRETPVKFVIHNKRTLQQIAGACDKAFEADSLTFLSALMDEAFWKKNGYNLETAMSAFIPNTYEIYWTITPKDLLKKMIQERDLFWDQENRRAKAKALNYSEAQVYTLASIVETESQNKAERPRIAGVYINRLRIGIPLQADPTLVFAIGDFSMRRIYTVHTQIDSPYNTYKYAGLPPGPIYMSSISSIDAVLNAEKHGYLYFCAKPDFSRTHNFAKSLDAHNVNAANYQRWLNEQGIQ